MIVSIFFLKKIQEVEACNDYHNLNVVHEHQL